jgi:uncharacterized protein YciI
MQIAFWFLEKRATAALRQQHRPADRVHLARLRQWIALAGPHSALQARP